jgi:hypothetical protein
MADRDDFEHLARALVIAREMAHHMLDLALDAATGVDVDDIVMDEDEDDDIGDKTEH